MFGLIITFIIILALLLILIVLVQNPKGGGLSSQFGGANSSRLLGVKKTGDILERLTWGFAIGIILLSLAVNFLSKSSSEGTDPIRDRANETNITLPAAPKSGGDSASQAPGK